MGSFFERFQPSECIIWWADQPIKYSVWREGLVFHVVFFFSCSTFKCIVNPSQKFRQWSTARHRLEPRPCYYLFESSFVVTCHPSSNAWNPLVCSLPVLFDEACVVVRGSTARGSYVSYHMKAIFKYLLFCQPCDSRAFRLAKVSGTWFEGVWFGKSATKQFKTHCTIDQTQFKSSKFHPTNR